MQTFGCAQTISGDMLAKPQASQLQAQCTPPASGEIGALAQVIEKDLAIISAKIDELEVACLPFLIPAGPTNVSKDEMGVAGSPVGGALLEYHKTLTAFAARLSAIRERIAI